MIKVCLEYQLVGLFLSLGAFCLSPHLLDRHVGLAKPFL